LFLEKSGAISEFVFGKSNMTSELVTYH